jgi:hypothetical protein
MKLVGFTNCEDKNFQDIEDDSSNYDLAWNLTIEHMKQNGLKFSGVYHQTGEFWHTLF